MICRTCGEETGHYATHSTSNLACALAARHIERIQRIERERGEQRINTILRDGVEFVADLARGLKP